MIDDQEKILFIAKCFELEGLIRGDLSKGFSSREIVSVLSRLLLEAIYLQKDAAGAKQQLIDLIEKSDYLSE